MAKRSPSPSHLIPISKAAVRRIRLAKPMTLQQLAAETGFSKATLVNIEQGNTSQMRETNALKLADKLGVRLSAITSKQKVSPPNATFAKLALSDREQSFPNDVAFQNLCDEPGGNVAVAYSWAYSKAQLIYPISAVTSQEEHRLLVTFEGIDTDMMMNIGFQPFRQTPRLLLPEQTTLGFSARTVANPERQELGLSLRLVDRKGRDWVYSDASRTYASIDHHFYPLDGLGKWTPCLLPLSDSPSEESFWKLFHTTSSTRSVARPDFSVIARLVIQFCMLSNGRLTSARNGQICISPIWLGSEQSILKELPTNHREVLKSWKK